MSTGNTEDDGINGNEKRMRDREHVSFELFTAENAVSREIRLGEDPILTMEPVENEEGEMMMRIQSSRLSENDAVAIFDFIINALDPDAGIRVKSALGKM